MAVIDSAEMLLQAKNYIGSGNWLDENNSHDGVITGATFDTDHFLFDSTGEYISVADHDDLDFTEEEDFTLIVVCELDSEAASGCIAGKKQNLSVSAGYAIAYNLSPDKIAGYVWDGTLGNYDDSYTTVTTGIKYVAAFQCDAGADIELLLDGNAGSPLTDVRTVSSHNGYDLIIGRCGNGSAQLYGKVYAVALWRSKLSDADIATAGIELLSTDPDPSSDSAALTEVISGEVDVRAGSATW